ncbi:MAG TPA: cyclase family protein [Thermoanaerobaculia bacterium]|nr:cyclase family protein [Thermoanaerobaculia bacterium]
MRFQQIERPLVLLIILALPLVAACQATSSSSARHGSIDLTRARLIDLTHSLDEKTIFWPTSDTAFNLEVLSFGTTPGGWFYASNAFCTPEHGGTHLDAPIHFAEGKWTTEQIPLERLIGHAVVIDVRQAASGDADYRLSIDDVRAWETHHGTIAPGSIVLLLTGWSSHWPDRKRYMGDDTPGDASNLHFPSYGEAAARLLVEERRVAALGVDTASIDFGASTDFIVHRIAAAANVVGLENLTQLEALPPRGAWVFALPIKISGGTGGPLRAIAVIP